MPERSATPLEPHGTLHLWRPPGSEAWSWLHLAVTTRLGGCSRAPYDSLNLGRATGDVAEAVDANRARVRDALGLADGTLHVLHQVHGARVVEAREPIPETPPEADGHWTLEARRVLVVAVADCVPVFVWDARQRRLALLHAGWRGTVAGIVRVGVQLLIERGSTAADLWCAVGPSIGPCCYEVGPEVREALPDAALETARGTTHVDLRRANLAQARAAGIPSEHLIGAPPCTACNTGLYFSHRKQGPHTGRQWALAWMTA